MKIIEDFKPYKDQFGLVGLNGTNPSDTSDNGALFTLEYLLLLKEEELAVELPTIKKAYESLLIPTDNGLVTRRFPGCERTDSMDNATGIVVYDALFSDGAISKLLYEHGEKTRARDIDSFQDLERSKKFYPIARALSLFRQPKRFYNVRPYSWSIQSWWGRSPGFMALLELVATGKTSAFGWLALLAGQFAPIFLDKGQTSGIKLTYVVWQLLKRKSAFWELAYMVWQGLLLKQYPSGMWDVYKIYFGTIHPLSRYAPKF
jgi:hypothetical protein